MAFFYRNNKNKVVDQLTFEDVDRFLRILPYINAEEVVAGFTRLFFHLAFHPKTNVLHLYPNSNQAEIFHHLALGLNEELYAFLVEPINHIDRLTRFKLIYSDDIKRELVGLALDLRVVNKIIPSA